MKKPQNEKGKDQRCYAWTAEEQIVFQEVPEFKQEREEKKNKRYKSSDSSSFNTSESGEGSINLIARLGTRKMKCGKFVEVVLLAETKQRGKRKQGRRWSLCKAIHSNFFVSEANIPSFRWNPWVPQKSWWGSTSLFNLSLSDILIGSFGFLKDKWASRAFHGVCLATLWHIWNWRNKVSHATTVDERNGYCNEDIFLVVQRISLLCVSNRALEYRVSWNRWIHSSVQLRPP
ncbi:hypothetical protein Tco_0980002 [Tanacetum coccineum]